MTQFQVHRADTASTRTTGTAPDPAGLEDGSALLRVERFGFSANNITYTVLGDRLGYWRFFPAQGEDAADWGVVPVWGYTEVVASRADALEVGERLFGFLPSATHLVLRPRGASGRPVLDTSAHRAALPEGYNTYQRVPTGASSDDEDLRALLFPLHITSWALRDTLEQAGWFGADQVVVLSASSRTALGLAQALAAEPGAPAVVGLTSARNRSFVEGTGAYTSVAGYDELESAVARRPSVVVDLAGSGELLGRVHRLLGPALLRSLGVGLTHHGAAGAAPGVATERTETFFAPAVIARRVQEWGPEVFARRSEDFVRAAVDRSRAWLRVETSTGLESLAAVYDRVRDGRARPEQGLVVRP